MSNSENKIEAIYTVEMNDEQLEQYLNIAKEYGFFSPKDISEQIEHSRELYKMLPIYKGELLDIGAGGGLPSFVFMNYKNEFKFTLLDAMKKRTDFLDKISKEIKMNKGGFKVLNGRAEEYALDDKYKSKFDIVIARGFGAPATTAECACNYLKVGGFLFVSGSPENEKGRWNDKGLEILGMKLIDIIYKVNATGVIIEKTGTHDSKYPRRDGVPRKRPLW